MPDSWCTAISRLRTSSWGSESTVCSEASIDVGLGASDTFSRPQALVSRYDEIFFPRKMEFKGGITDNTRSSFSRKY